MYIHYIYIYQCLEGQNIFTNIQVLIFKQITFNSVELLIFGFQNQSKYFLFKFQSVVLPRSRDFTGTQPIRTHRPFDCLQSPKRLVAPQPEEQSNCPTIKLTSNRPTIRQTDTKSNFPCSQHYKTDTQSNFPVLPAL